MSPTSDSIGTAPPFKVLLVGQQPEIGALMGAAPALFDELGIEVQSAWEVDTAIRTVGRWHPDGVLVSHDALTKALPEIMVVFRESLSDAGLVAMVPDEATGAQTFWTGVDDFLLPTEITWRSIKRALRSSQLQRRFMQDANRQRAMLSLALNVAHAGDWYFDLTADEAGEIIWPDNAYFSSEMKALLGYRHDEFPNSIKAWKQRMDPLSVREHKFHVFSHVFGNSPFYQQEYRIQHRDGRWIWVLSRGKILRDGMGKPARFVGIVMDISSIHQAQEGVQHFSETAAALVRSVPDAVYLFARDGRVLMVNEPGARRFQMVPDEMVGKVLWDLLPPEVAEARQKALAGVLETGVPAKYMDTRLGISMESTVFAIPDGNGDFPSFGVIVRDVNPGSLPA